MMQQPEPKISHQIHEKESIEIDLVEKTREKIRSITMDKFAAADKAFKYMH